jgi:hypothetical protein
MGFLAFRDGQKDKQDLICCATEEETKMVFCVLGKLRRCGDYGGDPFEIRSGGRGNCAVREITGGDVREIEQRWRF